MCVYNLCCLFQAQSSVMNGTHVRPGNVSNPTDKFSDGVSSTTQDGHSTRGQSNGVGHSQELQWLVILSGLADVIVLYLIVLLFVLAAILPVTRVINTSTTRKTITVFDLKSEPAFICERFLFPAIMSKL